MGSFFVRFYSISTKPMKFEDLLTKKMFSLLIIEFFIVSTSKAILSLFFFFFLICKHLIFSQWSLYIDAIFLHNIAILQTFVRQLNFARMPSPFLFHVFTLCLIRWMKKKLKKKNLQEHSITPYETINCVILLSIGVNRYAAITYLHSRGIEKIYI